MTSRTISLAYSFFLFLIVASATAQTATIPTPVQTSTAPALPKTLAQQVADTLAIKPGSTDILPELAQVIKTLPSGDDTHLDKLVDAILDSDGTAFIQALHDNANVNYDSILGGPKLKWPYGSHSERYTLRGLMWAKSKSLVASNPARARDYACATLYFAALDDFFPLPAAGLYPYLPKRDAHAFTDRGLTDQQAAVIADLVDAAVKADASRSQAVINAERALDRLFKHPDEIPAVLTTLQKFHDLGLENSLINQWQLAHLVSILRNHARAAKNDAALQTIEAAIKQWQKSASPDLTRWLKLALASDAPPVHLYGVTKMVNGKWVNVEDE